MATRKRIFLFFVSNLLTPDRSLTRPRDRGIDKSVFNRPTGDDPSRRRIAAWPVSQQVTSKKRRQFFVVADRRQRSVMTDATSSGHGPHRHCPPPMVLRLYSCGRDPGPDTVASGLEERVSGGGLKALENRCDEKAFARSDV